MQADKHSVDLPTLLLREKRALERAQAGEPAALEPILAQHAEALFMCILGFCGERSEAEALLKETFVTALERSPRLVWAERSLYHWLRQLALQKLLDHHRAVGRRKRLCQALTHELAPSSDDRNALALTADDERRRAEQRIEASLAPLAPRYAQAIRLRLCSGKSRPDCAAAMGLSLENFDLLLFRAVQAFRRSFGEPDGGY